MLNFSVSLPDQVFYKKPKSVLFYDYDEVLFGSFWATLLAFYRSISEEVVVKLVSREMILNKVEPITIRSGSSTLLSDALDEIGALDSIYNCQDFYLWDDREGWALCASRDLETAVLGLYDCDIESGIRKSAIVYTSVINDIVSSLVVDIEKVEKKLRSNYGDFIVNQ